MTGLFICGFFTGMIFLICVIVGYLMYKSYLILSQNGEKIKAETFLKSFKKSFNETFKN